MKKNSKGVSSAAQRKRKVIVIAATLILLAAAVITGIILSGKRSSAPAGDAEPTAAQSSQLDESLLHGEKVSADRFVGRWITYANGKQLTYDYDDDGCAVFRDESGNASEYHYEIQDDRIVLTSGEKRRIYIWSPIAASFIVDHQYGESANLIALVGEQIKNFSGYMYADGDYLYVGKLCLCPEEAMKNDGEPSLVGTWTGASGDRVTFTADGAYHYREKGLDYDGTYSLNADTKQLTLKLAGTDTILLSDGEWGISGRVLHLRKNYYFRDKDE